MGEHYKPIASRPNFGHTPVYKNYYSLSGAYEDEGLGFVEYTTSYEQSHEHFFCQWCGEMWADILVIQDGEVNHHMVTTRPCRHHGNGTLVTWTDPIERIVDLPRKLLERELMICPT